MSSTEINKSTVKHSGNQYKEAKTTQFRYTSFDIQNVFQLLQLCRQAMKEERRPVLLHTITNTGQESRKAHAIVPFSMWSSNHPVG